MARPGAGMAPYQAPAVDKALDVLEFLANQPEGASMKEITLGLGRSMSEIYRMVLALENRRFVHKDRETERYYLSLKLFELAHRYPPTARLVGTAQPILEDLAARAMQSCHLGVADGGRLVVPASASSPMPMYYAVKLGSSFPLLETSSGVVLTAFAKEERIEAALEEQDEASRRDLLRRFAVIRRSGREVHRSESVDGVTNISAVVRDHAGQAIAALTVPYLRQTRATVDVDQAESMTVEAASGLSVALGFKVTDGE